MQKPATTWKDTKQKPITTLLGGAANKKGKNKQVKLKKTDPTTKGLQQF